MINTANLLRRVAYAITDRDSLYDRDLLIHIWESLIYEFPYLEEIDEDYLTHNFEKEHITIINELMNKKEYEN